MLSQAKVVAPQKAKNHVKFDQKLDELKKQSKELDRPYLNKFDHLLKSKQPPTTEAMYDELFGDANAEEGLIDDGYYDEEASPSEVRRNKMFRQEEDNGFYNKYTQVYTKNSKK